MDELMSLFVEIPPLVPEKWGIGARKRLILEVLSNSPGGVWRSPRGPTNIHISTNEIAGAVHFDFFYHICATHYHQAPL